MFDLEPVLEASLFGFRIDTGYQEMGIDGFLATVMVVVDRKSVV